MRVNVMSDASVSEKFMSERNIPAGYSALPLGLGFNDAIAPVYVKVEDGKWHCGFFIEQHHLNPANVCHGGVYMTFADLAMAGAIGNHINEMMGISTTNLNLDFLAPSKLGDWLELRIDHIHATRLLATISGVIDGPNGVVARTNATFRLPKKLADK